MTRDRGVSRALVDAAVDAGFGAIVVTVDAPVPGRRERDFRTGFRVPLELTMPAVSAALGRSGGVTVEDFFSRHRSERHLEASSSSSRTTARCPSS